MSGSRWLTVDETLLRAWRLPEPQEDGDKERRGSVLVIAGSREMPGAAVLTATAALRAGAGKLVVATPQSAALTVAAALPEARVIALPEASDGGPTFAGLHALQSIAAGTAAVVAGPGMIGRDSTLAFLHDVLQLFHDSTVLLDALAMDAVDSGARLPESLVVTPHAGEMAHLTGAEKSDALEEPHGMALRWAARWNVVVTLKGPTTCIAVPDGRTWLHSAPVPGLGTSGSGDVLAGIIAGLAARGAPPEQAAVWGVALHARAGQALAQRLGILGYLARELPAEIPALMQSLSP